MIRIASTDDVNILTELSIKLWPEHTQEEMDDEIKEFLKQEDTVYFISFEEENIIGFAQCQLRYDYVEGTTTSPVGYLEAIYIEEEYRQLGYAKKLVRECESWAKSKGCTEFASDCELDNNDSFKFHLKIGFEEVNRIICFSKKL